MCLNSMVDTSAINSIKNTTNAITTLPSTSDPNFIKIEH